jgi:hypothetical protein
MKEEGGGREKGGGRNDEGGGRVDWAGSRMSVWVGGGGGSLVRTALHMPSSIALSQLHYLNALLGQCLERQSPQRLIL